MAPPATTVPANSAGAPSSTRPSAPAASAAIAPTSTGSMPNRRRQPRRGGREQAEAQHGQGGQYRRGRARERQSGPQLGQHRPDPGHRGPQVDRDEHHRQRQQHPVPPAREDRRRPLVVLHHRLRQAYPTRGQRCNVRAIRRRPAAGRPRPAGGLRRGTGVTGAGRGRHDRGRVGRPDLQGADRGENRHDRRQRRRGQRRFQPATDIRCRRRRGRWPGSARRS